MMVPTITGDGATGFGAPPHLPQVHMASQVHFTNGSHMTLPKLCTILLETFVTQASFERA